MLVGLSLLLMPSMARAEPPGCYSVGGTENTIYLPVNCPTEGSARAVSQFGACFIVLSADLVRERDCDNLDQPGNAVPESGTITNDGRIRCRDGSFVDDPGASGTLPGGDSLTNSQRDALRENACSERGGYESLNTSTGSRDAGTSRDELSDGQCETSGNETLNAGNCGIIRIVVDVINFLSALAGIVIVFSIMFAGFQYMTARDNSGQIQQARTRIIWAISALLIFIFMYSALNFLVPGGLGIV